MYAWLKKRIGVGRSARNGPARSNKKAWSWISTLIVLVILALLAGLVYFIGPARAVALYTIQDNPTGGDCTLIGTWDNSTKTCTLTTDVFTTINDAITIASNGITLGGAGHSIQIDYIYGQNGGRGVVVDGRTGVTVRGLVINNFSNGDDIFFNNSTNGMVTGNIINGGSAGVGFYYSTACTASGNTINGGSYGIMFNYSTGCTALGNTVSGGASDDVLVWFADNNIVSGNQVSGPTPNGIRFLSSNGGTITGNHAISCGISVSGDNATVSNNIVDGGWLGAGISIGQATSGTLSGNTVTGASYGISAGNASGLFLTGNTENNNATGLLLTYCMDCSVTANTSNDNAEPGIHIGSSDGTSITNSTATRNRAGLYGTSANLTISGNNFSGNENLGMEVHGCTSCLIQNNQANDIPGNGFHVQDSNGVILDNNTANNDPNYGIQLLQSPGCALTNNTTAGDGMGIVTMDSPATISGNTVSNNVIYGILLGAGSGGSTLSGNTITNSGFNFSVLVYDGYDVASFNHNVDTTNTIDGKPMYYLVGAAHQTFGSPITPSIFYCVNCDDVTISGMTMNTRVESAVRIIGSQNVRVENMNVSNANYGITLQGCTNSTVSGSTFSGMDSFDVWVIWGGSGNMVRDNTMINSPAVAYGVNLALTSGHTVTRNTITGGQDGVSLDRADGNTISYNTFSGNEWGMELNASNNNSVFRNNIDSLWAPCVVHGGSGNTYSQPAPIGGNYWSSYDTPSEGCFDANGDGVCDNSYIWGGLQGNGFDVYPWTSLSGWNDTAPPEVSNVLPSGSLETAPTVVSADYLDRHFAGGIDTTSIHVYLDGTEIMGCTVTAIGVSCPVSGLSSGAHTISGTVADVNGHQSPINSSFTIIPRKYYFTWYDCVGASNWVLMANPANGLEHTWFELAIAGVPQALPAPAGHSVGQVPAGDVISGFYRGVMGGPVEVGASSAAIVSQRILWPAGGSSLEEVLGTDSLRLSDHFYWTWYDMQSAGYKNWMLVANPDKSNSVYAEIRVAGSLKWNGIVPAGGNVTPIFPGVMGGPVEVQAWTDAVRTGPAEVMASQRVLINGDTAFNEVPGIPASDLMSDYLWTWYDETVPGNRDWVLVANPSDSATIHYTVKIAGVTRAEGDLAPGARVTPEFPGVIGGPVEVTATGTVIASQRVLWGPSFEEVPGTDGGRLANDHHWTWYDQQSAGMTNWVLVANPTTDNVYYEISVDGILRASGDIPPGGNATPTFPGIMGGPVEVRAWTNSGRGSPAGVIASQRVLYNGYFNEVLGTLLD